MTRLRYVYAICRPLDAPLQAELTGVGGVPPALLHHQGLVAVVSKVPETEFDEEVLLAHLEDAEWRAAAVRAHEGVIDALTTVTTPLPLRLATVVPDDSGVRTMIESRGAAFRRILDRLEGRLEWGVRMYLEPGTEPGTEPETGTGLGEGSESAEPVPAGAVVFARSVHERLARYAEDSRLHAPHHVETSEVPGRKVLDAAYLVPRADCEKFVELVDRAKDEAPGLRVELSGPWAAYSFTGEA
ncbi:GvpL/GvpF family gas vesicle protein [Streptomyces sp. NPDC048297]|uniref:GvpL/GvpF family gas vesicle protein n=1 Tax=Streptomyces sp. NPDC048297 TaxID=3365531 RepID=UPI003716C620